MGRRLELKKNVIINDPSIFVPTAQANFVNNGKQFTISFALTSAPTPPNDPHDPQKDTHRDIKETDNNVFGTDLSMIVEDIPVQPEPPDGNRLSRITISFTAKTKVPGSGG